MLATFIFFTSPLVYIAPPEPLYAPPRTIEALELQITDEERQQAIDEVLGVPEVPAENCLCVRYVRNRGLNVKGNAKDLVPNSVPTVGGGVLFKYPKYSHIALIEKLGKDRMFISESNYRKCQITTRWINYDDKFIIGFVN